MLFYFQTQDSPNTSHDGDKGVCASPTGGSECEDEGCSSGDSSPGASSPGTPESQSTDLSLKRRTSSSPKNVSLIVCLNHACMLIINYAKGIGTPWFIEYAYAIL